MAKTAAQVLSAKQSLIAAQGREKPTVGFKAGMASPMEKDERTTYAIGLEVSWIIGDGGRREADTAAQAANLKAAEQKLKGQSWQEKESWIRLEQTHRAHRLTENTCRPRGCVSK